MLCNCSCYYLHSNRKLPKSKKHKGTREREARPKISGVGVPVALEGSLVRTGRQPHTGLWDLPTPHQTLQPHLPGPWPGSGHWLGAWEGGFKIATGNKVGGNPPREQAWKNVLGEGQQDIIILVHLQVLSLPIAHRADDEGVMGKRNGEADKWAMRSSVSGRSREEDRSTERRRERMQRHGSLRRRQGSECRASSESLRREGGRKVIRVGQLGVAHPSAPFRP